MELVASLFNKGVSGKLTEIKMAISNGGHLVHVLYIQAFRAEYKLIPIHLMLYLVERIRIFLEKKDKKYFSFRGRG